MLKQDRLKTMLRTITDEQFKVIWKDTYGYVPFGDREDLLADFVTDQCDEELDDCIERAQSFLTPAQKSNPKRLISR
jgi:hypothetical protein